MEPSSTAPRTMAGPARPAVAAGVPIDRSMAPAAAAAPIAGSILFPIVRAVQASFAPRSA
ncbi:MAG: hypothetical protein ABN502_00780 [Gammaproteobacteria bacterium]|uniref:hypothetical protein n=1 Tax=Gammaproteobacteria TaxID=1236 RepID=UPI00112AC8D5|nr:hypothetical protein [Pseudomonas sp. Hp2]